jgi:L-amino acid N-acyltransferase YncA
MNVQVRNATAADAPGILDIYAPYIESSAITFESDIPSVESFAGRISHYQQSRPWIVCEINGRIAGYVYAGPYRERVAYQWCCECSVYIHEDFKGIRLGQHLYSALLPLLAMQGYRNVYAVITLPNDASVRLHERCGFEYFATFEQVGYKLGAWQKVGWWRLPLNNFEGPPAPPLDFPQLDLSLYTHLYNRAAAAIEKGLP